MINNLNEDMFFYIVNYLNIDDIYKLRLSYNNCISYWTMIVLLHERNYLEHFYDDYDTDGICDLGDSTPWGECTINIIDSENDSFAGGFKLSADCGNIGIHGFQLNISGIEIQSVNNDILDT